MLYTFLGGAIVMGFAVATLLFLRFWRRTREGLFLAFSGSFLLLGVTQTLLSLGGFVDEQRSWLYLLRLAAFLLILLALFLQNRRGAS
ncbi:MAG TPA: DUF5985 family protein [Croceibacterium sp.]|nr:DUF5985 family protein [Croceibacterium sp.]